MFLSGGIDSCIVGTLMRPHVPPGKRLPSYTVGMKDSPDVTASREVAKKLGYDHNERICTSEEACSIIDKVIYHLETYDVTTIRAGTPMFPLAHACVGRAARHVGVQHSAQGPAAHGRLDGRRLAAARTRWGSRARSSRKRLGGLWQRTSPSSAPSTGFPTSRQPRSLGS